MSIHKPDGSTEHYLSKPDEYTELQYYAAARADGWSFGDEDSPYQYCSVHLSDSDIADADIDFWKEEFNWWKDKP